MIFHNSSIITNKILFKKKKLQTILIYDLNKSYKKKIISCLFGEFLNFSKKKTINSLLFFHKKSLNFINFEKIKADSLLTEKKKKSYKYYRYCRKLPIRGQRTHTNAQTSKRLHKFY